MFARLNQVTLSWWFGHAVLLGLAVFVVGTAILMDPTPEQVSLFGWDVPVMCSWRQLTGIGCPGCGLTRSFSFMAHGQILSAFQMNLLGPPLFAVVAFQLPFRAFTLWRGPGPTAQRAPTPG